MTCIVGLVDNDGTVWMGADRRVGAGSFKFEEATPKIFRGGRLLVGVSGAGPLMTAARYMEIPEYRPSENQTLDEYMRRDFSKALWEEVERHHGIGKDDDGDASTNGWVLVGGCGALFSFDCTGFPIRPLAPYHAEGSGKYQALGALHALSRMVPEIEPHCMIEMALEAAAATDPHVGPPFDILNDRVSGGRKSPDAVA